MAMPKASLTAVISCILPMLSYSWGSFGLGSQPSLLKGEKMVPLGPDGLSISPMGIGTWSWGNKLLWGYDEANDAELQKTFDAAVDGGITFFDTGDSYGTGRLEGRAELLLGQFQSAYLSSGRKLAADRSKRVVIGTKLATYPWRLTANSLESALRSSLTRLGRSEEEGVELMQLHWSAANYAPWQEPGLRAGLAQCYSKGLAKGVGASNYGPTQLRSLHADLAQTNVPLASNQVQFSLLSRQPLTSGLLDTCRELGVVPIGYSPLALGLLSGRFSGDEASDLANLPAGPRGVLFKQILPGLKPLLTTLNSVAATRRKTVAQVAINWCVCKGVVPIVGANTVVQVEENLGALGWRLTADQVRELDAAAEAVPRGATQNIFQTS